MYSRQANGFVCRSVWHAADVIGPPVGLPLPYDRQEEVGDVGLDLAGEIVADRHDLAGPFVAQRLVVVRADREVLGGIDEAGERGVDALAVVAERGALQSGKVPLVVKTCCS